MSDNTETAILAGGCTCHFARPGWKLPHPETAA